MIIDVVHTSRPMGLASQLIFWENSLQFKATFHVNNNISVNSVTDTPTQLLADELWHFYKKKICGRNKAGGEETTLSSQHEKTHSINVQIQPVKCHNPPDLVNKCPKIQK